MLEQFQNPIEKSKNECKIDTLNTHIHDDHLFGLVQAIQKKWRG
jgi:hypothetical protein